MDVLGEKLAELADKLGVSIEALWPMMVGKVVVDWWTSAVVLVVLWVAIVVAGKKITEDGRDRDSWFWEDGLNMFSFTGLLSTIGYSVAVLFVSICTVVQISSISDLFYPEVAALHKILALLGGM